MAAEEKSPVVEEIPVETDAPATVTEPSELEKYWKAVKDNRGDFTGWTYLLQYVEQEDKIDAAREAFDGFVSQYPYCYGYWKKYADMEKKHGSMELAEKVFEHGLLAIPLSIDLWLHFLAFIKDKYKEDEMFIRKQFERAITAAGTDFRSDKLWDMYIGWEKDKKRLRNVTTIYDRLLSIPTQLYSHHFEQFQMHVKQNHPKEILSLDEFLKLRQEVVSKKDVAEEPTEDEELPPGLDLVVPPGEEDAPPGTDGSVKEDNEEVIKLREKIIEIRQEVHRVNEEQVSKRWTFEEGIRRPYFHVKPLEKSQLKNWKEYLDFEIENGSLERVMVLFERCVIACALYEDFWLKYAKYMEPHSISGVRHVYKRACTIHLPKKATLHLSWAAFEERQGNYEGAMEVLKNLEENMPHLAMVSLRRISLERRQGNFSNTEKLYKSYIADADSDDARSFYAIKYSRYLSKIIGNPDTAKKILEEALEKDKLNHKLYLQLIDTEYQRLANGNECNIIELFDKAITSPLAIEHRVAFSQRKLEFLEDFSSNITRILDAYTEHQKLIKEMQSLRKRKNTDTSSLGEGQTKKSKVDNYVSNGSGDPTVVSTADQAATTAAASHTALDGSAYHYQQWPGYNVMNNYGYQYPNWGAYSSQYYNH